jgi:hypothetical protein
MNTEEKKMIQMSFVQSLPSQLPHFSVTDESKKEIKTKETYSKWKVNIPFLK